MYQEKKIAKEKKNGGAFCILKSSTYLRKEKALRKFSGLFLVVDSLDQTNLEYIFRMIFRMIIITL